MTFQSASTNKQSRFKPLRRHLTMNKLKLFRLYDTITKKYTDHSFNSKSAAKGLRLELNIGEIYPNEEDALYKYEEPKLKRYQVRRASDHRLGET